MAEYFVKNGGSDAAAGTSDGTAWATIGKVNGITLNPGDIVNFKRGSRFNDNTLTGSRVGTSGSPITFRAYGSDLAIYSMIGWTNLVATTIWWVRFQYAPAAVYDDGVPLTESDTFAALGTSGFFYDRVASRLYVRTYDDTTPVDDAIEAHVSQRPILGGGWNLEGWTAAGAAWWATITETPTYVVQDEYRYMTAAASQVAVTPGTYFFDAGASRIYLRTFDDDNPTGHIVEAPIRSYGALMSACENVVVEDIEFRTCALDGWLGPAGTTNLTMRRVLARACRRHGIYFAFTDSAATPLNTVLAEDCESYFNGANGITWASYHTGLIHIKGCISAYNCHRPEVSWTAGIRAVPADFSGNVLIEDCICNYNGTIGTPGEETGYGIWLDSTGINCIVRRCTVTDNVWFGIDIEQVIGTTPTNGCEVSHNIVARNTTGGITIRTGSNYAKAWNNTLYDNGGYSLDFVNPQTNVQARNNIVVRGALFPTAINLMVRNGAETTMTLSNNCFGAPASGFISWEGSLLNTYPAAEVEYGGDLASIEAAPQLIDPENDDFRIAWTSPCWQAGITTTLDHYGAVPDVGMEQLPPLLVGGATGLGL